MSVNLHLSIEVRNYDPYREGAITEAIAKIIKQEGLSRDFGKFERKSDADGKPLLLIRTNPLMPVIISRSYIWIPEMEKRLEIAVCEANGGACDVRFHGDDADSDDSLSAPSRVDRPAVKPFQPNRLFPSHKKLLGEKLAGRGPRKIEALYQIGYIGHSVLDYCSAIDPNDPIIHTAIRSIAQSVTGVLLLCCGIQGQKMEISLGDRKITLVSAGPQSYSLISYDVMSYWAEGWYAALMARDEECLELLSGISNDAMPATPDKNSYYRSWKNALIAFRSAPESAPPHIESAIKLAQPEYAQYGRPGVEVVHRAIFPMLSCLVQLDAAAFNERLAAALKAHRDFWGPKPSSSWGWIARGPLALCCLAHDLGIQIEVESDYLLAGIIDRRFAVKS